MAMNQASRYLATKQVEQLEVSAGSIEDLRHILRGMSIEDEDEYDGGEGVSTEAK